MPHLITGTQGGKGHVTSANDGAIHARIFGSGRYALDDVSCHMETANLARVEGGLLLFDGRFVEIEGAYEGIAIANGSQGMKRHDLVGLRYTIDSDGYEYADLVALEGEPSEGEPQDPHYDANASIEKRDAEVFWPLFRIPLDGLNVGEPVDLTSGWGMPVSSGGTGATTTKEACANLGAFAGNAGGLSDVTPAALYNVAPGAYTVSPTATGSPCPGQYGNMVVSRSGGNRTWAVVAFDQGGCYMLSGWTKDSTTATWVRIDGRCKVLSTESGAFMHAGQTIRLSDKVSNQPTGIVIVWSYYNESASKSENQHFVYQFVPKSHVEHYDGCGVTLQVATGTTFNFIAQKYVFVSDSAITGYAANAESGAKNGVTFSNRYLALRGVLGV